MSIIERDNPLNLAYKVVIVTNASSPVGVIISNTLLKANALVLGTDSRAKDHSLSASTYSHFQFHQCKLTDTSAAEHIIADAKHKFKTERINGLINLESAEDDAETSSAHQKLALACAEAMDDPIDGGALVNTIMPAGTGESEPADAAERLRDSTKTISSKVSSQKVRCNAVAPMHGRDIKSCQQYESTKEYFNFLFEPLSNQRPKEHGKATSAEKRAMFELSNVILFLTSDASREVDGVVLDSHGQLL